MNGIQVNLGILHAYHINCVYIQHVKSTRHTIWVVLLDIYNCFWENMISNSCVWMPFGRFNNNAVLQGRQLLFHIIIINRKSPCTHTACMAHTQNSLRQFGSTNIHDFAVILVMGKCILIKFLNQLLVVVYIKFTMLLLKSIIWKLLKISFIKVFIFYNNIKSNKFIKIQGLTTNVR